MRPAVPKYFRSIVEPPKFSNNDPVYLLVPTFSPNSAKLSTTSSLPLMKLIFEPAPSTEPTSNVELPANWNSPVLAGSTAVLTSREPVTIKVPLSSTVPMVLPPVSAHFAPVSTVMVSNPSNDPLPMPLIVSVPLASSMVLLVPLMATAAPLKTALGVTTRRLLDVPAPNETLSDSIPPPLIVPEF